MARPRSGPGGTYASAKAERAAKWSRENPDRSRRNAQAHREKNPRSVQRAALRNLYGAEAADEYERLYVLQAGACAICGTHETKLKKRLGLDHCHSSGRFRGLLCFRCNAALGLFGDDLAIIKKAIAYLKRADADPIT